ncbi:MAG TPA: trypsin-like peptidase domain-containing protein [Xanthomonadaceae bacterium]|nr:trypsin-like peptidase domain-containing protein [Xanthomonadaceae bacterium]
MRILTFLFSMLVIATATAQPPSQLYSLPSPPESARLDLPAVDVRKELAADAGRTKDIPLRYAVVRKLADAVDAKQAEVTGLGHWSTLPDGRHLWRLEVSAPGAVALDFGFSHYRLAHGAELWIHGDGKGNRIGPFTDADNKRHGQFWTPRVLGDWAIIELAVPAAQRASTVLELGTVHQAYRDIFKPAPVDGAKSGSCNVDVVCPEGDAWRPQIRSVVLYTRGAGFCSGQLMNSTASDGAPLVLTANHCRLTEDNAAGVVTYFRYENSTCRAPGSSASGDPGDGQQNLFVSGAALLAGSAPGQEGIIGSDFSLLRLDAPPPDAAQPFFSGWDRRDLAPGNGTAIHHPSGDEKRISFENDPLAIASYLGSPGSGQTHLRVADWDLGTTEPGSSGSGLWNSDQRLVGVLSGGLAACGNDEPDWYGRLTHAWDTGSTPDRRLREWLDPATTGVSVLDGTESCDRPGVSLQAVTSAQAGAPITFTVVATGGDGGPYLYGFDLDGDGIYEREQAQDEATASYPSARSVQVGVRVTDFAGCSNNLSRALDIRGPAIVASAGSPIQVCGDNDAAIEPGEHWRLPVTLRNQGDAGFAGNGYALFAPGAGGGFPIGPDAFGYAATTSALGGCGYSFVDIASGALAVPALATSVFDGNSFGPLDDARTTDPIALGGAGLRVYGQNFTQAFISTNGYISFSNAETGADFFNTCDGTVANGSVAPRLHVLHDDLVVGQMSGAGLRYRYFPVCPRASDTSANDCHVFQWSRMQRYSSSGAPEGDFEFQALIYGDSNQLVYQFRTADPLQGGGATIGLVNADPANGLLNVSCNQGGTATAGSAACIFAPEAIAGSPVRFPQAAQPLGALAMNASTSVNLDFALDAGASCGAALGIDFVGAASPSQSSPQGASVLATTVGGGGSCQVSSCPAPLPPQLEPRYGIYYQLQRSGNGLFNYVYSSGSPDTDDIFGGIWYTARADHTPAWYIINGPVRNRLSVADVLRFTNTDAPSGFAPVGQRVGRAWVMQPETDRVVFAWDFEGQRSIELLGNIGLPFSPVNRSQQWYPPSQSGWGTAIESNALSDGGYNEFLAMFFYDAQGDGRWVIGTDDNDVGSFSAVAFRVHCPGCPYYSDQLLRPLAAGSISRSYQSLTESTVSTAIVLPESFPGNWTRSNVPFVPFATPIQ